MNELKLKLAVDTALAEDRDAVFKALAAKEQLFVEAILAKVEDFAGPTATAMTEVRLTGIYAEWDDVCATARVSVGGCKFKAHVRKATRHPEPSVLLYSTFRRYSLDRTAFLKRLQRHLR